MLSADPTTRVMIYCAPDAMSPFSRVDIEFPHQLEIKVNQDEVKANLRGLKNKPGTTRPADITSMLRHKTGYNNYMVVTYALTKKVGLCLYSTPSESIIKIAWPSIARILLTSSSGTSWWSTWSDVILSKSWSPSLGMAKQYRKNKSFGRVRQYK